MCSSKQESLLCILLWGETTTHKRNLTQRGIDFCYTEALISGTKILLSAPKSDHRHHRFFRSQDKLRLTRDVQNSVRRTTMIEVPRLAKRIGINVVLASEAFQCTGSFKFRAALHVASRVPENLLIAASSGNFGQAMAYACTLLKKSCIIVMPTTSAKVKIDAVREFGGRIEFVDVGVKSRAERVAELARQYPNAYVASAYDDPLVIEGNSSLGRELAEYQPAFDDIVVPIGGGGLSAGIIQGVRAAGRNIPVVGAEPLLGNDAARSLMAGKIVKNESEPQTVADGARTISLGRHNWEILRNGLQCVVEVPEQKIVEGVRVLFETANVKAEPTGALSLGAILTEPTRFQFRRVCCVVSGGNVDPALYTSILGGSQA
jgi:threonine dehydratase